MTAVFESCKRLLLIGSAGRNSGKTTLALALIRALRGRYPVAALKVTSVAHLGGACPRGGKGCGACALASRFALEEERGALPDKDTARMLQAGASPVYWLRALRSALAEGYAAFRAQTAADAVVVCESNSLREAVAPGCFVMLSGAAEPGAPAAKPSAARVMSLADIALERLPEGAELERLAARIVGHMEELWNA